MDTPSTEATQVRKDVNYYFNDGDCVLLADNHIFRVHRFLLKRHSAFFRNMFDIAPGYEQEAAMEGSSDNNPITCHDSLDEFQALCWLMYANPKEIRNAQEDPSFSNISTLILVATMADKYEFEAFEEWALEALEDLPHSVYVSVASERLESLLMVAVRGGYEILVEKVQESLVNQIASSEDPLETLSSVIQVAERSGNQDLQARVYYEYLKAVCFPIKSPNAESEADPSDKSDSPLSAAPLGNLESSGLSKNQQLCLHHGYHTFQTFCRQLADYPDLGACDDPGCKYEWREWWKSNWARIHDPPRLRLGNPAEAMDWMQVLMNDGPEHARASAARTSTSRFAKATCRIQRQRRLKEIKDEFKRGLCTHFGLY
ncbi:hypothetical protein P691DRAFT_405501 [Macrolepiota fuliginosa MF-IS2]|uniref:BTB domain-containing protein n=1 Tax=Macrolepiota fuliginosa MF-IS2 TaxID=1400762 RepID=A0A9P5XKB5_9AGAR|nr:hypothetical protein P691DRAFT_405501 [Macrolepiota fuliginosa MF-IS2]